MNSARQSVQFFIISKKHEEIGHRINKDLHRGVTFIDGVGCYTGAGVKMMFVLAKKRESTTIFRLIKDIDPNASFHRVPLSVCLAKDLIELK